MKLVSSIKAPTGGEAIALEAASWLAQLDAGRLSASDRMALAEWVSRSPAHALELQNAAQLWQGVDMTFNALITPDEQPSVWKLFKSWVSVRPAQFGAACVLAIAVCALPVMINLSGSAPTQIERVDTPQIYSVAKGELLVQTLPDGSVMHVNTDTQVEVDYTPNLRTLRLIKGEAYFDVAHNPDRPFEVYAGGNRVQAVGTAFVVSLLQDNVDVIVTDGKVRVDQLSVSEGVVNPVVEQAKRTVYVPSGHRAEVKPDSYEVAVIEPAIIDKQMAWQQGQLIFSGDRLEDVTVQVQRYSDLKIVISDPSLRDMPVSGTFSTKDIGPILKAIEYYGLDAEYVNDNLVYLTRRADVP